MTSLYYQLNEVDTHDYNAVSFAIVSTLLRAWPEVEAYYVPRLIHDVHHLFDGEFLEVQPMDTRYHDLEHTLQASLCFTRIMVQRHLCGVSPIIDPEDFKLGLIAVALHDTGYLKSISDHEGTGAKFTRVHEQRSCQYAARYLQKFDFDGFSIDAIQKMIRCTGPFSDIASIEFPNGKYRIMGQAVCTADYISQMSDKHYVGKLYHLYEEFEESDDYNGVPKKERVFAHFEDLLAKTPDFWEKIVKPRMEIECDGLWEYLTLENGANPYCESIERNIEEVRGLNHDGAYPFDHERKAGLSA